MNCAICGEQFLDKAQAIPIYEYDADTGTFTPTVTAWVHTGHLDMSR